MVSSDTARCITQIWIKVIEQTKFEKRKMALEVMKTIQLQLTAHGNTLKHESHNTVKDI